MAGVKWQRPVPTIGDRTSAAERAADPRAWSFPTEQVDALHAVIEARRDVRRFRPDEVPADVLRSVLGAGHRAPSVGHSQPWRFIVVRDPAARDRAAALADRERMRQAGLLEPERRRSLLDLQLEGIREAPVGVVVACDRRSAAAGVLGRATFPDTDLWSCACAIENIWLAARAAGLGLGWVTLFQPADLAELVDLPEGVVTLGWLCLGWPDERPPEPGLERQGWSRRLDLDAVVMNERWPADEAPAPPPSYLAAPGPAEVVGARDSGDDLLAAPGSLGVLDATVDRVLALPGDPVAGGTLVVVAGDHPVVVHGVSAYPASVTGEVLDATAAGDSLGAGASRAAGLRLSWRHAVAREPGDITTADALSTSDAARLIAEGVALGAEAARHGLVCLGEVGIGNTTVAAALACALLELEPDEVVGRGAGADAAMVERKTEVVSAALARARATHGAGTTDPMTALATVGGPEFAVLAGVTLGAGRAGAPVVLDGLATSVSALAAVRMEPSVRAALVAGQRSRERGHAAVLTELGLEPLLDLRLRAGEGVGACLAARLLLNALAVRQTAGRVG